MKEEKDHRPKEKRVTLLTPPGATGSGGGASGDSTKGEDKQDRNKEKKEALSKVLDWSLAGERAGCVCIWEWGCLLPLPVSPSDSSPVVKPYHTVSSVRPKRGAPHGQAPGWEWRRRGIPDKKDLGQSCEIIMGEGNDNKENEELKH